MRTRQRVSAGWVLITLLLLGAASTTWSADASTATLSQAGLEWVSLHYKEPGTMQEYGSLYGVDYSYTRGYGEFLFGLQSSIAAGTVRYDGALMDGTPYKVDTHNMLFNFRGMAGRVWQISKPRTAVTVYAGLGYRYLVDDLPPPYGYLREQSYIYVPLGLKTMNDAGEWRWGMRAEYDLFLAGYNLSGGDSFTQDSGYGYQLSAYLTYVQPGEAILSLSLEPFYRYWSVEESTMSPTGYVEPKNNCTLYGVRGVISF